MAAPQFDGDEFGEGYTEVLSLVGSQWQTLGDPLVGQEFFDGLGQSVAIDATGSRIVVGAERSDRTGESRVFDFEDGQWSPAGVIPGETSGSFFGPNVAITPDGSRILVGTPDNDEVADSAGELRVFDYVNGEWVQFEDDINGRVRFDDLGKSVAISSDGGRILGSGSGFGDGVGLTRVFDIGVQPVICDGLEATIVGTPGNDTLTGTSGPDVIAGLQGNDVIHGLGGDDIICAGKGDDTVFGGDGFDILFGAQGNDRIFAANGAQLTERSDTRGARMFGGAGNDIIYGSDRWDRMQGGAGADTLLGYEGRDWMRGGADRDHVEGGSNIDDLHGGNGNDRIIVDGNDMVRGGAGLRDNCTIRGASVPQPLISCELRS